MNLMIERKEQEPVAFGPKVGCALFVEPSGVRGPEEHDRKWLSDFGGKISVHGPIRNRDMASLDAGLRN